MDEFLTVAEVAEMLKVNPQTIRNWIDRGDLAEVRVGARRVRIRRSELHRFLESGSRASAAAEQPPAAENLSERWEQLGAALSESSGALAGEDPAALVRALEVLADAAGRLADALRGTLTDSSVDLTWAGATTLPHVARSRSAAGGVLGAGLLRLIPSLSE